MRAISAVKSDMKCVETFVGFHLCKLFSLYIKKIEIELFVHGKPTRSKWVIQDEPISLRDCYISRAHNKGIFVDHNVNEQHRLKSIRVKK